MINEPNHPPTTAPHKGFSLSPSGLENILILRSRLFRAVISVPHREGLGLSEGNALLSNFWCTSFLIDM